MDAAVAARSGSQEQPPPWLDVTMALQFMTDDGRLVFHAVGSHSSNTNYPNLPLASAAAPRKNSEVLQLVASRAPIQLMSLLASAPLLSQCMA